MQGCHKNSWLLLKIIANEKSKFGDQDSRRIIIGGHQDGAIVTLAAFTKFVDDKSQHLGGVFSLSGTHVLNIRDLPVKKLNLMKRTPLFLYHGKKDPMITL